MSKLNKIDSGAVLALMEHKGWETLLKLVALTINELNSRPVTGTNEFETLRSLHVMEGKVEALEQFFNELEQGMPLTTE